MTGRRDLPQRSARHPLTPPQAIEGPSTLVHRTSLKGTKVRRWGASPMSAVTSCTGCTAKPGSHRQRACLPTNCPTEAQLSSAVWGRLGPASTVSMDLPCGSRRCAASTRRSDAVLGVVFVGGRQVAPCELPKPHGALQPAPVKRPAIGASSAPAMKRRKLPGSPVRSRPLPHRA